MTVLARRLDADVNDADEILLGFAQAVREAGVPVTADRSQALLDAVALVDLGDRAAVRAAARATLCGCLDDLDRLDRVFDAWFSRNGANVATARGVTARLASVVPLIGMGAGADGDEVDHAAASEIEVLRHRDVARLADSERERVAALFASLRPEPPTRRATRRRRSRHGEVDASRTLRSSLRRMGEPARIEWRRRGVRPRRVVVLLDVSGSMSGYADALLRLTHRMVVGSDVCAHSVEAFTLGTRLTHVTRALQQRDPERALLAAGEAVPDWSGGTRLGETLKAFLDRRRDMARGAVVVVVSDGWECGGAVQLGEQMARLHRLAHRVVWANPHRGKDGYLPVQAGITAALPYVDDFVAGHSLATYEELLGVIARA